MSKWCVDCRYSKEQSYGWLCKRLIGMLSPVTGEPRTLNLSCDKERVDPTGCGPEGKFWEQKT
jgi:hypothetical protein